VVKTRQESRRDVERRSLYLSYLVRASSGRHDAIGRLHTRGFKARSDPSGLRPPLCCHLMLHSAAPWHEYLPRTPSRAYLYSAPQEVNDLPDMINDLRCDNCCDIAYCIKCAGKRSWWPRLLSEYSCVSRLESGKQLSVGLSVWLQWPRHVYTALSDTSDVRTAHTVARI
jgi:hypothetical protein